MGSKSVLNARRALEGVHGVHVVQHAPFSLEEISHHMDSGQSIYISAFSEAKLGVLMQRAWKQRPGCFRPIRCCLNGDQSATKTIANVITSLPFISLGVQAPSLRKHKRRSREKAVTITV